MELGSVTAATIFMRPPQAGHSVTSRFHTLDKSTAQVNLCRRWAGDESPSLVLPGGYPHFLFSPRHNLRPVGRMERQHAVVAHQIQAGWRHRRHQFLQQLVWRRSAASTQVAACREKPREAKHNQPATSHPLLGIDQPASHSLPGTVAGGHLPLDRSGGDHGQQRLRLPQWIDVNPLPADHGAATGAPRAWPWSQRSAARRHRSTGAPARGWFAIRAGDVDAVRHQHMEMWVAHCAEPKRCTKVTEPQRPSAWPCLFACRRYQP